ncbi:MarR family winged helix-turn-helix transcriptional regulator [Actinopolymorpha alba]|uniref:MarR family winged helix-turn-helix transcriptional regulator n=1 Tax=Actinopolymorpha alba TaxID=533267 RepID=UPI0003758659|nr:MarR family winged helix-turn-helix transcriptional regulator [Actinopolymorpha alba]
MSEEPTNPQLFLPQLVGQAINLIFEELYRHLVESGHQDLRPTHCLNVFRFMDCDGTRPTTLARRAGMTPQAMSELLGYLERHDYVRRVPDPNDGRGRVVVYADRGTQAAEIATTFFADMEARWGAVVGPDRLQDVKAALAQVLNAAPLHGAHTPQVSAP